MKPLPAIPLIIFMMLIMNIFSLMLGASSRPITTMNTPSSAPPSQIGPKNGNDSSNDSIIILGNSSDHDDLLLGGAVVRVDYSDGKNDDVADDDDDDDVEDNFNDINEYPRQHPPPITTMGMQFARKDPNIVCDPTNDHNGSRTVSETPSSRNWIRLRDQSIPYRKYNKTHPFPVRIVGIFVADSELPYTLELAKPSINIAIEKAERLFPTTKWENAVFRNGSNRCTSNFAGVFAAEEFYLRRVTVFIGPSCGLALDPVARMAAHWRIPVISSGGPHVQFSNKKIFSTLTRLSFSLSNLGSFVCQIFHLFKWKHVSMIIQEKPTSPLIPLIKETIIDMFDSKTDIQLESHEISRSLAKTNLKNLLIECAKESRIMLILTSGDTLRQILLAGFDLGMNKGGYVFITVELFKHANSFGNFDWFVDGDSRNDDVKRMYESLFILTVPVPMTEIYQKFANDVIQKSRNEFNTSFTTKDVNVILAGFHDSVIMYGVAVTETIADGHDPMDGLEVTKRLWNRTFKNYLSGDIYINANGDKETDYTLEDFDPQSFRMRSVIIYSGREDQIIWSNVSSIHWPGNRIPPSDVAVCYADIVDLYCGHKSANEWPVLDILIALSVTTLIVMVAVFFVYRKMRLESELTSLWWKIRWNEIIFIQNQSDRSLDASKSVFSNLGAVASSSASVPVTVAEPLAASIIQHHQSSSSPAGSGQPEPTPSLIVAAEAEAEPSKKSPQSNPAGQTKPHIRINDYFNLPNYLQHLSGVSRAQAATRTAAISLKETTTTATSSSTTNSTGTAAVINITDIERSNTVPTKCLQDTLQQQQHHNPNRQHPQSTSDTSRSSSSNKHQLDLDPFSPLPNKGIYKGSKLFIKHLNIKHLSINREILIELKQLKDLAHENLIRFVGICADDNHISILTEYCEKGNLRDLLDNEAIRIDWPFRYSLINDIVEGMLFIHESPLTFHGSLKSPNCVIDSRLVVKLTDIGLRTIRNMSKQNSGPPNYKSLLWTAPEHLRQRRPDLHGSQKGDIYSFGIVLQEIITRSGPFETVKVAGSDGKYSVVSLDPQFIIQQLKLGGATPYRPNVDQREGCPELIELLEQCWDENPNNRPTFSCIRTQIRKISKDSLGGSGTSFLENLLLRLEQYANDLEILVEQKTSAFFEEKRKCEELLYELLPKTVADQLKRGNQVKPESFQCVTIFFSDIVQFTQIAAASTPIEIVDFLNDLYTLFDSIIASYDVYKVETVGDAYMVVSGLPERNGIDHARQIARMSLELLDQIKKFQIKHLPQQGVRLRIGIHSGPCAAGVIGLKMPRYCLFGDTVNTASRMESHGEPNKIHTSEYSKNILDRFGTFNLSLRGDIYLKGKGIVRTYWLNREESNKLDRFRFSNRFDQTHSEQMFSQQLRSQKSLDQSQPLQLKHQLSKSSLVQRKCESLDYIDRPEFVQSIMADSSPSHGGTTTNTSGAITGIDIVEIANDNNQADPTKHAACKSASLSSIIPGGGSGHQIISSPIQ